MQKYNKALIFFDTNAFESRHNGKDLYLYEIVASSLFYDIRDAVNQLGLSNCVKLCLPEVVWSEVKQHLIDGYRSAIDSLDSKIKNIKEVLGDLIDVYSEIHLTGTYKEYVDNISKDFLANPKNQVILIDCPRDSEVLDTLIENAIKCEPPFKKATAKGKEYHDAGLKDALIWETLKRSDKDCLVLYISNDTDFLGLSDERIKVLSKSADVSKILFELMDIPAEAKIQHMLLNNDAYLLSQILIECEIENYSSAIVKEIVSSQLNEEENVLSIECCICIDEISYTIAFSYDLNASELVEAHCNLQ